MKKKNTHKLLLAVISILVLVSLVILSYIYLSTQRSKKTDAERQICVRQALQNDPKPPPNVSDERGSSCYILSPDQLDKNYSNNQQ